MAAIPVSAIIIAHNAEATIGDCLKSLARFDDVVVYENGSTDATADIARGFANVHLEQGGFLGFGPTKNKAASFAKHDWVLALDSDELASAELVDEIAALSLDDPKEIFEVDRHNYFLGKHIKHAGWGNDWLPRFYNRHVHSYNEALVHENVIPVADAVVRRFSGSLQHNAILEISQLLTKMNRYTDLRAQEGFKGYGPLGATLKALWAFLRSYVMQLGVLDGWRGFVIACDNGCSVFFRCIKCYVRDLREQGKL